MWGVNFINSQCPSYKPNLIYFGSCGAAASYSESVVYFFIKSFNYIFIHIVAFDFLKIHWNIKSHAQFSALKPRLLNQTLSKVILHDKSRIIKQNIHRRGKESSHTRPCFHCLLYIIVLFYGPLRDFDGRMWDVRKFNANAQTSLCTGCGSLWVDWFLHSIIWQSWEFQVAWKQTETIHFSLSVLSENNAPSIYNMYGVMKNINWNFWYTYASNDKLLIIFYVFCVKFSTYITRKRTV